MSEPRPLSGIRVLDFGHCLAGPLVGMMLADMGAEVIRVDPPRGPRFDDPAFAMQAFEQGWVRRTKRPREVSVTQRGEAELERHFGISMAIEASDSSQSTTTLTASRAAPASDRTIQ